MSTKRGGTESIEQIIQAAVGWWVLIADDGLSFQEGRKFLYWLLCSPRHLSEFLRVCFQDEGVTRALHEKRHQSRDQSNESHRSNVTHVDFGRGPEPKGEESRPRYHIKDVGVAATILLMLSVAAFVVPKVIDLMPADAITITANEAQTMQLTDGSDVELSSNSSLQVDFTDQYREVLLSRGKAIFDVATDVNRPFRVRTSLVDILAVGTKFAVTITNTVEIEVYEGVVEVLDPGMKEGAGIRLRKGALYRVPVEAVADGRVRLRVIAIDG